jgi:hypothetical protein
MSLSWRRPLLRAFHLVFSIKLFATFRLLSVLESFVKGLSGGFIASEDLLFAGDKVTVQFFHLEIEVRSEGILVLLVLLVH